MINTTVHIFVYGTLKCGGCNHFFLLQSIKGYSATAYQTDTHAGPHYPFAARGQGQAVGEVYEVNEAVLRALDDLEDHPYDSHRELTPVVVLGDKTVEAWILPQQKSPSLSSDSQRQLATFLIVSCLFHKKSYTVWDPCNHAFSLGVLLF